MKPAQITPNEFRRLFPKATPSAMRVNGVNTVCDPVPVAEPEQPLRRVKVAVAQGAEKSSGRVRVHVESRRNRLLDADNILVKAILDCCRYAGAIRDDTEEAIELVVTQKKVPRNEECTVVTITPI